jgi:hypothetical protein
VHIKKNIFRRNHGCYQGHKSLNYIILNILLRFVVFFKETHCKCSPLLSVHQHNNNKIRIDILKTFLLVFTRLVTQRFSKLFVSDVEIHNEK